jgi:hypothetical protein
VMKQSVKMGVILSKLSLEMKPIQIKSIQNILFIPG